MTEVFNLEMNADLVVLSACQTGLGNLVRGEGDLPGILYQFDREYNPGRRPGVKA